MRESEDEFTIDAGDRVVSLKSRNGIPQNDFTAEQFVEFLARQREAFPKLGYAVGTEWDHRRTTGRDFFLIIQSSPESRPRPFIVKKGEK